MQVEDVYYRLAPKVNVVQIIGSLLDLVTHKFSLQSEYRMENGLTKRIYTALPSSLIWCSGGTPKLSNSSLEFKK
jgi:hypothetical protein